MWRMQLPGVRNWQSSAKIQLEVFCRENGGYSNLFFNHFVVPFFKAEYASFFCIILDLWKDSDNCKNSLVNAPCAHVLWIFSMTEHIEQVMLKALLSRMRQWEYKIKRTHKHQNSCWFRSLPWKFALGQFVNVPKELPLAFRRTYCDENLWWTLTSDSIISTNSY